ncbi:MAG TPA: hypothetical protein VK741_26235, partial [Acetobacteraceae bacterium]|nr:hypothetical protein [Acetobacteraceae bacterium]
DKDRKETAGDAGSLGTQRYTIHLAMTLLLTSRPLCLYLKMGTPVRLDARAGGNRHLRPIVIAT